MKKYYFLFLFTLALPLSAITQSNNEVHHVIITLDRSRSMVGNDFPRENSNQIKKLISAVFSFLQQPQSSGRPLLQKGDYVSFVGFGLHSPEYRYDNSFDDFIMIRDNLYQDLKGKIVSFGFKYKKVTDNDLNMISRGVTDKITGGLFNKRWGVISISKQLTLHYLYSKNKLIQRTFIILITDRIFNGETMDPIQELNRTKVAYDNMSPNKVLNISNPLNICKIVKENYLWEPYPFKNPFNKKIPKVVLGINEYIYATSYEYIPLQKFFAIESCYRFDNQQASFMRAYNGYSYTLKIESLKNPNYGLLDLIAYVKTAKGNLENKIIKSIRNLNFVIPRSEYDKKDTLVLKFYLHFKEKAYNASVLYPEGGVLRGSKGLIRKIPIKFEPNAKIFNQFELTNAKYLSYAKKGYDNQNIIARKIENKDRLWLLLIAIVLGLSGLIIYLFRKRKNRNPKEL